MQSTDRSSEVTLRLATLQDLPAINAIYNEAVETTVATFDTQPRSLEYRTNWFQSRGPQHAVIVCEVDGEVRGWASLNQHSDRAAYDGTVDNSIYILEKYRRLGYGRLLLESLIAKAREHKLHTILAVITEGNEASVRLHSLYGFEMVGTMKEVGFKFNKWIDVSIMQLLL